MSKRVFPPALAVVTLVSLLAPATIAAKEDARGGSPGGENAMSVVALTVCPGGPPDCGYATVQEAVDAAHDGDIVKIAAGIYTDVYTRSAPAGYPGPAVVTQSVYISKTIVIRGGYTTTNAYADPPDPRVYTTTLDARGQGRVLLIAGQISPTLEGLRVTGGDAANLRGAPWGITDVGGGIYIAAAAATLRGNWVLSNSASAGGGLFLLNSEAALFGNTISGNVVSGEKAYGAGLMSARSAATLVGNVISNNTTTGLYWGGGGGLFLSWSPATIDRNFIIGNTAQAGGGLYLSWSDATLVNNVIADNVATSNGSGVAVAQASLGLLHATIARNSGGAGEGVYVYPSTSPKERPSVVTLTNTILVSHTIGIYVTAGNTVTLEATLWGSGTWANDTDWAGPGTILTGTRNFWGEPAFISPEAGDYHISAWSAARDVGVYAGIPWDVDSQPRPYVYPDLGADEYWPLGVLRQVFLPLIMKGQ